MKPLRRRSLLKLALPAGVSMLFVPAWLRSGGYRLPPLVRATDQAQDAGSSPTPTAVPHSSPTPTSPASGVPPTAKLGPPGPNRNVMVGGLQSVQGNILVLQDAEGVHTITLSPSTTIDKAAGSPTYSRVRNADSSRLRRGDGIFVSGTPQSGGSIAATLIVANLMLGGSAIADVLGADAQNHPFIDARRQVSMTSPDFDAARTRLWIAPDAEIKKLGPDGHFIPAQVQELNPGQHIAFQALKADDGSIVVITLLLGNGKPPGVP